MSANSMLATACMLCLLQSALSLVGPAVRSCTPAHQRQTLLYKLRLPGNLISARSCVPASHQGLPPAQSPLAP